MVSDVMKVDDTCDKYLKEVKNAYRKLENIKAERDRIRSSIDGLKAVVYDKVGGSATMEHGDDAMFRSIEKLEEAELVLSIQADVCTDLISEWVEVSNSIDPEMLRIIDMHYFQGMTWEDIAKLEDKDSCKLPCSVRTVYRIRSDAMLSLYDAIPKGWQ